MEIIPLAAESMGVRSMATFVETKDCCAIIDPGAIVEQFRSGLPPHPVEEWCLAKHLERIHLFTQTSDIIIITHYHDPHFFADIIEHYRDKILLIKNPNQLINVNQRNRAFKFLRAIQGVAKDINYADGRILNYGNTQISFSPPIPHGASDSQGFIIQVAFREQGYTFVFSSDVQGPYTDTPIDFIVSQNPELLYLDGPMTYLQGDQQVQNDLENVITRIKKIIEKTKVINVIIDHHLLRDHQWDSKIESAFNFARQRGVIIQTAAEFRGEENNLLEARRVQLYENDPPSKNNST